MTPWYQVIPRTTVAEQKAGRAVITPDVLMIDDVRINGVPVPG